MFVYRAIIKKMKMMKMMRKTVWMMKTTRKMTMKNMKGVQNASSMRRKIRAMRSDLSNTVSFCHNFVDKLKKLMFI